MNLYSAFAWLAAFFGVVDIVMRRMARRHGDEALARHLEVTSLLWLLICLEFSRGGR